MMIAKDIAKASGIIIGLTDLNDNNDANLLSRLLFARSENPFRGSHSEFLALRCCAFALLTLCFACLRFASVLRLAKNS